MAFAAIDEFGRQFIIMKEQESKCHLSGLEAGKANVSAGKSVARILRSSLGPKGMDKMLQSPDGEITISYFSLYLCSSRSRYYVQLLFSN